LWSLVPNEVIVFAFQVLDSIGYIHSVLSKEKQ